MDWSGRQRLQREQQCKDRERKSTLPWLKAPQERSDEEIEAVPAERVCLERKSTVSKYKKRVWKRQAVSIRAMSVLKRTFFSALNDRRSSLLFIGEI